MKLSRLVEHATGEKAPIPAPSPVHIAFVGLLGQFLELGKEHPAAAIMKRIAPSMLRDVAEIPAPVLAKWLRFVGAAMVQVADAEGEDPALPDVELGAALAFGEVDYGADALDGTAGPLADQPALPAG